MERLFYLHHCQNYTTRSKLATLRQQSSQWLKLLTVISFAFAMKSIGCMSYLANQASQNYNEFLQTLPTKSKSLILCVRWANTFRNIARLIHVRACGNYFLLYFILIAISYPSKKKASGKKMQLQEVTQKIKMQIETFIYFLTKIANFPRSDMDIFMLQSLCRIL